MLSRTDSSIDLSDTSLPQELKGKSAFSVHWTGNLTPNETGDFVLGMQIVQDPELPARRARGVNLIASTFAPDDETLVVR